MPPPESLSSILLTGVKLLHTYNFQTNCQNELSQTHARVFRRQCKLPLDWKQYAQTDMDLLHQEISRHRMTSPFGLNTKITDYVPDNQWLRWQQHHLFCTNYMKVSNQAAFFMLFCMYVACGLVTFFVLGEPNWLSSGINMGISYYKSFGVTQDNVVRPPALQHNSNIEYQPATPALQHNSNIEYQPASLSDQRVVLFQQGGGQLGRPVVQSGNPEAERRKAEATEAAKAAAEKAAAKRRRQAEAAEAERRRQAEAAKAAKAAAEHDNETTFRQYVQGISSDCNRMYVKPGFYGTDFAWPDNPDYHKPAVLITTPNGEKVTVACLRFVPQFQHINGKCTMACTPYSTNTNEKPDFVRRNFLQDKLRGNSAKVVTLRTPNPTEADWQAAVQAAWSSDTVASKRRKTQHK